MNASSAQNNSACYRKCDVNYKECIKGKEYGSSCYVEHAQCAYSCSAPP